MDDKDRQTFEDSIDELNEAWKLLRESVCEEFSEVIKSMSELMESLVNSEKELDDSDIYKEIEDEKKMKKVQRKNCFNNIKPNHNIKINRNISKFNRRNQGR